MAGGMILWRQLRSMIAFCLRSASSATKPSSCRRSASVIEQISFWATSIDCRTPATSPLNTLERSIFSGDGHFFEFG